MSVIGSTSNTINHGDSGDNQALVAGHNDTCQFSLR